MPKVIEIEKSRAQNRYVLSYKLKTSAHRLRPHNQLMITPIEAITEEKNRKN